MSDTHTGSAPDSLRKSASKLGPKTGFNATRSGQFAGAAYEYFTPAFVQDLADQPALQEELNNWWTLNLTSWVAQAMPAAPSWFYDPATTNIPSDAASVAIQWNAFSGRIQQFYSANPPVAPANPYKLNATQVYSLADTGYYTDSSNKSIALPNIPATLCPQANWSGPLKTFGPYGPRGWQDEYCEWSVFRNTANQVVRVDFTCENPEYWTTLWKVSPERVVELYNSTLNANAQSQNQITVTLADLQLTDASGKPVIDPNTGRPAYNPLNKWNSGPISVRGGSTSSGGAMHLTSTPNTLQTEIGLAGASSVQYASGNLYPQPLICCGNFGQEYRHSDPHIGQSVSQAVNPNSGSYNLANLANPFGLYIQLPNFANWTFGSNVVPGQGGIPANAQPSDIWQIVRGSQTCIDPVTGQAFPGNMILHAACQIPLAWLQANPNLTLADILINGRPIQWAGQIAETFNMTLYARPLPAGSTAPPVNPCTSTQSPAYTPLQCMYSQLWNGYYPITELAPTGAKLSLASNTTFVAPWLPANGKAQALTLTCTTIPSQLSDLQVAFLLPDSSDPDSSIGVTVNAATPVTYAVPGNSYPDNYFALSLSVTVGSSSAPGLRSVQITVNGNSSVLPDAVFIPEIE
ncbi:hypothetical protein [Dyella flagellata]|uniref:Uncharacterized protein n=1 Tax=Dyella flagellata TaxID=1867833 RepID=A0ABQ5XBM7_9GAMM|nr:hypothetical protein [Dyella flagellata]GLQ89095.1 hypothetical protein GCM10007898_26670 [Dyella flagellata]